MLYRHYWGCRSRRRAAVAYAMQHANNTEGQNGFSREDWDQIKSMMRRRRHRHEEKRQRRRPLGHGDLRLLVLTLINEKPRHGYDLIREIEDLTSGIYQPSPGVMYPALEALQDLGLITAKTDSGKKVYHATEEGKAELNAQMSALDDIEARLKELAAVDQIDETTDVRSAMRRLRHTVKGKLSAVETTATREHAISKILAEAQAKIRKLD